MKSPTDRERQGARKRILGICCGLFVAVVAEILLGNGPHWYTSEEHKVPAALTQMAGVALVVQGGLLAFLAALCIARGLVPLTLAPDELESPPAAVGGGPVLPLCGLLFVLAGIGPLERSQRAAKEYAFAQSQPGRFQDWAVELERRLVPVGRTFAVLWFGIAGALIATPLYLNPRVWQLRRRLNRLGRNYAVAGLLLSLAGVLVWLVNAFVNAVGGIAGGRNTSHELSVVGYLGMLAGAVVAVAGSIIAVVGRSEVRKLRT